MLKETFPIPTRDASLTKGVKALPRQESLSELVRQELDFMNEGIHSFFLKITINSLVRSASRIIYQKNGQNHDLRDERLQKISAFTGLDPLVVEGTIAMALAYIGPCLTTADRDVMRQRLLNPTDSQAAKKPEISPSTQVLLAISKETLLSLAIHETWSMVSERRAEWLGRQKIQGPVT